MAYLKAVTLAVLAAVAIGTGMVGRAVLAARGTLPADKATILSQGVSEAMNCVVFFTIAFVPAALLIVFVRRRRRGHGSRA